MTQSGHAFHLSRHTPIPIFNIGLFGPAIVKFFSQRGLRIFLRFESGHVPHQRHEHERNDANVEEDDGDPFKIVFHLKMTASVGETTGRSSSVKIAACSASTLKTTWIFRSDEPEISLRHGRKLGQVRLECPLMTQSGHLRPWSLSAPSLPMAAEDRLTVAITSILAERE